MDNCLKLKSTVSTGIQSQQKYTSGFQFSYVFAVTFLTYNNNNNNNNNNNSMTIFMVLSSWHSPIARVTTQFHKMRNEMFRCLVKHLFNQKKSQGINLARESRNFVNLLLVREK